jgi:uncharacterized repeat protein (TIGR04138 family)
MNPDNPPVYDFIIEKDPRYKADAYDFVMEALEFSQKRLKSRRHVSGQELLDGIKQLLMRKFGPLTMVILEHWGIKSTEDFGHIVFNLVENNLLTKTEEDCIDHFRNGYDFEKEFRDGYHKRLHRKISRMR